MKKPREADYDYVIVDMFEKLINQYGNIQQIPFTKDDLVESMEELKKNGIISHIKNIPDIKYTYDARRDFPNSILKYGFWAIIGSGKGKYFFEKISHNNLIRIPNDLKNSNINIKTLKDKTPNAVKVVLGDDEQATMTRLRYNDVISDFLEMETYQVQGHERTSISCGQIEVDEIYVGHKNNQNFVIPISAKGGPKDCLSYSQVLNLSLYAQEKVRFKNYIPIPLGVLRVPSGEIYIVKFNAPSKVSNVTINGYGVYKIV